MESNNETQESIDKAKKEAEHIASEGTEVRGKIRELLLDVIKSTKAGIEDAATIASNILEGAMKGINDAVPEEQESVLRQTYDGLMDAGSTFTQAMRMAFEQSLSRGEIFAKEDLKSALDELKDAEKTFISAIDTLASQSKDQFKGSLTAFVEHARATGTAMRPAIDSAIQAAKSHPLELVSETASAGGTLTRKAAGQFLRSVGSLLESTGETLLSKNTSAKETAPTSDHPENSEEKS